MALADEQPARIPSGWVRALLLLTVYLLLSLTMAMYLDTIEGWVFSSFVAALATVYLFRVQVDRKDFLSLGLYPSGFYPHAITGLLGGTLLPVTGALLVYALNGIRWTSIQFSIGSLLSGAALMLLVAFTEELLFRGYILRNLRHSMNRWMAVLVSTLLFTALHAANAHLPTTGVMSIFAGGWLMGVAAVHSRSLWFPVGFHFSWNFVQGPILGFPVSGLTLPHLLEMDTIGSDLLTGGAFGFEGSLVGALLLTAVAGGISYLHARQLRGHSVKNQ